MRARNEHQVNRVLIVDWDVHHGNGTQDIFYEDPSVFFFSTHRYGFGSTLNVPVTYGTPRAKFHDKFSEALDRAAEFRPELVLISAGFDAHRLDPIGDLGLEVEDYMTLTRRVLDVAQTHAGGRVVSCLEGGYHWNATAESVAAHLKTLIEHG
jgi:acetoin utilization deacetylase AcuC-like enzyme